MKKILVFTLLAVSLSACSTTQNQATLTPKIGSPNPASKFCVDQGGTLEIKDEANGQVGYCHLKDGQIVEEWKLFRESQSQCLPKQSKDLVGQQNLSDEQIKQATQSEIIRRVAPGQPVTMDYRNNRVTVVIEHTSKKIVQANCG